MTEGWADILEEALAFCSCSIEFAKFKRATRVKVNAHVNWRGLLLVDVAMVFGDT